MKIKVLVVVGLFLGVLTVGCAKKKVVVPATTGDTSVSEQTQGSEIKGLKELQEKRARELQELKEKELKEKQAKEASKEEALKIIGERIFFDFDSYELKPEARQVLQKKAEVLKAHPDLMLIIEGHCDERGTEEYNLALGEKRARAAYEFLILLGVEANRMQIVSYGEEYPLDPGHNETAWAKNRRDEFKIVKK
ncbi:MAG: peptidoglycan-associated lipoprotein [Desulfonauticus sp.]|nr:MAG: Peptidoglycan-associated lipoprotein [Desulfonauticus sp. 38_4375]MDK2921531.1 peptidoglycan-associated lipoprotein [Desulfonauticus sp.]